MIQNEFSELQNIFELSDQFNEDRAQELIDSLKLSLLEYNSVTITSSDEDLINKQTILRSTLEYDALLNIHKKSNEGFERAMSQLNCFYFGLTYLPPSEKMSLLISINLVHCLTLNNLVDFNIEMELAKNLVKSDDKYINYAYELHHSIIDNSFSRLFELESNPPSLLFNHFTKALLNGARKRYADAIERSYYCLTFTDLGKILRFSNIDECLEFVKTRKWHLSNDMIWFNPQIDDKTKSSSEMLARSVDLSVQISALA